MKFLRFLLPGFQQNWKVVLLSVLMAATFWFFNAMSKNYDARLDYPLTYIFDRDSVVVVEPLVTKIKIDVSSGGWNLIRRTLKISATPVEITLENPTDIKFLTRSSLIPMLTDQLDGLKLTYVVTDTLFFNIEKKEAKKLPIYVDSASIPMEENYRITSAIEFYNDSVTVVGPKSIVSNMNSPVLLTFEDTGINSDFEKELGYDVDPILELTPKKTAVRFDVSRFLLKELDIPIEFLHFPADSSVQAVQTDIKLYYTINEDNEKEVIDSDFSVTLDYNMLNRKDSTITPLLMYAHDKAMDIVLNVDKIRIAPRNR